MDHNDLKRVIEALIFAADAPLVPERIRETLEACSDEEIAQVVEALNGEYEAAGHAFMIRAVAGGYQVTTRPQFSNWIKKLYLGRQKGRLSQAALESLAIIAFKQPISRVDIAQIRGVNSDGVIGTLLERKLITISGRSEGMGRPLLYSTTPEFLEFFGINELAELPKPREIEELIGKEGMSEEVLQALSSDKQLKLPISFDSEPEASQPGSGVPSLSPEEIVAAVSVKTHEAAADKNDSEEAAPQPEREEEAAPLPHDAGAASEVSTLVENEEPLAIETPSPQTEEETQSSVAHETVAASGELTIPEEQVETVAAADFVETPVQAEVVQPASVMKEMKKRKRGKRDRADDEQRDGREEAVTTHETFVAQVPASANDMAHEEAGETISQDDDADTSSRSNGAPEITAAASEEPLPSLSEAEAPRVVLVAAAENASRRYDELAEDKTAAQKIEVPQIALDDEDLTVQIVATPNRDDATPQEETAAFVLAEEEAQQAGLRATTRTNESSLEATPERFERTAFDEADLENFADEDVADFVAAANTLEATEVDAWPEVTEVRVDEPRHIAEEFAPIALSEMSDEPQTETRHAASHIASEEDFAECDQSLENVPAHAAPARIASHELIAATARNGEQPGAAQPHEMKPSSNEEHVFFV